MIATFPEQREAKRQALLDAVESLRDVFLAGADEAEKKGTLPQATVDAIYESGLFSFKTAQVLGGAEADTIFPRLKPSTPRAPHLSPKAE